MSDAPTPPSPEPAPDGKIASAIAATTKLGRWLSSLTPDQGARLMAALLTFALMVGVGYLLSQSFKDRQDQTAFLVRSYEAADERARLHYSGEREKERQHCERADERTRQFYASERDKDRASQKAFVHALTIEMVEWRRVLKKTAPKEVEQIDAALTLPKDREPEVQIAPMPRLLSGLSPSTL